MCAMCMCVRTPVCASVCMCLPPTEPSRLGTFTHVALPTPESYTVLSISAGQPPAWHSRGPGPSG